MYRRILAPILYLNDVTDGGCTEITLANVVIPPVAGNAMIIPSQPPWYHRGLPSKTQDKYVITTWLEWMPEQGMLELIHQEENIFSRSQYRVLYLKLPLLWEGARIS